MIDSKIKAVIFDFGGVIINQKFMHVTKDNMDNYIYLSGPLDLSLTSGSGVCVCEAVRADTAAAAAVTASSCASLNPPPADVDSCAGRERNGAELQIDYIYYDNLMKWFISPLK